MIYFTIKELTASQTAVENGIDNTPNEDVLNNLYRLGSYLDSIRQLYNAPIYVNSGYRCEKLNTLVGGAKRSYHQKGLAADITTRKGRSEDIKLYNMIVNSSLRLRELILEPNWIHVAVW